jgi:hypothetical protein
MLIGIAVEGSGGGVTSDDHLPGSVLGGGVSTPFVLFVPFLPPASFRPSSPVVPSERIARKRATAPLREPSPSSRSER